MHWLTKYTNKKYHAHSDMHSITWPYLFNNHPYINSSKLSATGVPLLLMTHGLVALASG